MSKRDFRARRAEPPAYPQHAETRARRLVVSLAAAAAISGGLASCSGVATPPKAIDAGQQTAGEPAFPDAGQPDSGTADAGPVDQNLGGGPRLPEVDAGRP